MNRII